ncbi:unnamed protein product [Periconia digitata]|uniref:Mitochondrial inner membrane protease ATP23 n=1 Tax=Periconia digitata TaxID=1303443 RepID=A0A9W4XX63_9PLEO|nr:unnamed protein product [Periconia digitata]
MSGPEKAPVDGAPAAPAAPSSSTSKPDRTYYTWANTFSILLSRMNGNRNIPLERAYFAAQDNIKAESFCRTCESRRDYLLQYSPTVTFLRDEVAKLGGQLDSKNIHCRMCTADQSGGFHMDHGIMLCANSFRNRGHQEDTMAHEMVHAWDHLKFKVGDDNMKHHACLEIRAATLSGECRFTREFFTRNQWRITEQLQNCVRRRATLSMMARPAIKNDVQAAKVVNEVWDSCFYDTRPFDEIYR